MGVCEKFRVRKHPNNKKDELRLINGLLRCKSGCGLWNRDRNGSFLIVLCTIQKSGALTTHHL